MTGLSSRATRSVEFSEYLKELGEEFALTFSYSTFDCPINNSKFIKPAGD